MAGLMQWRNNSLSSNARKELYVQDPGYPWRHHRLCKHYRKDTNATWGGMQTQVACKAMGYELLHCDQAISAIDLHQIEEPAAAKLMPLAGLTEDQRQRWTA